MCVLRGLIPEKFVNDRVNLTIARVQFQNYEKKKTITLMKTLLVIKITVVYYDDNSVEYKETVILIFPKNNNMLWNEHIPQC